MNIATQSLRSGAALMAGLLFGAGVALAQTADVPKPSPEMRAKMEERCKADPQKCEAMKKRLEERRAACEKDPEACKKQHEERRAKMEEHRKAMKAECEKDPEACKQKREEMRKKMEERCKGDPKGPRCGQRPHRHRPDGKTMPDKPIEAPPVPAAPAAAK
jgi:hypothetical protein